MLESRKNNQTKKNFFSFSGRSCVFDTDSKKKLIISLSSKANLPIVEKSKNKPKKTNKPYAVLSTKFTNEIYRNSPILHSESENFAKNLNLLAEATKKRIRLKERQKKTLLAALLSSGGGGGCGGI